MFPAYSHKIVPTKRQPAEKWQISAKSCHEHEAGWRLLSFRLLSCFEFLFNRNGTAFRETFWDIN